MKYLISILFIFTINLSLTTISYAQGEDEDFLASEVEEDMAMDEELTDEEELDFETDDFVDTGDAEDEDEDLAQNNSEDEIDDAESDQELSATANEMEESFDKGEGESAEEELMFQPASSYGTFREKKYEWSIFFHYGYQFANVSTDFATSTSIANLPEEFDDMGLDIVKNMADKPWIFGGRVQIMSESTEDSTTKTEYSMNLLTGFAGYKFIDGIVTVAGTLGLIFPLSADATVSTLSGSTSTDKDFKIGISYTAGVMSVIKLKRFLMGFDGGMMYLQGQELGDDDFDRNHGGYMRLLLGLAF